MTTFFTAARNSAAVALVALVGFGAAQPANAGSIHRDTALINKYIQSLNYAPKRHNHGWKKKRHYHKKHYGYRHHYGKRHYGNRHYYAKPRYRHYDHYAHAPRYDGLRLDVFFKHGSAQFTYKAKHALDNLGYALQSHKLRGKTFLIEGHTDATGSAYANQQLSERRAIAVKRYLVHNFDISPSRLVAVGFGEDRPYRYSDPYAGVNRRVEIKPIAHAVAYDFGPYKAW